MEIVQIGEFKSDEVKLRRRTFKKKRFKFIGTVIGIFKDCKFIECTIENISGFGHILIINPFEPMSMKAGKNKKKLFSELADSLRDYLAKGIKEHTGNKPIVIPDLLNKESILFTKHWKR